MDSEDSREASSGSDSNGGGPRSPDSVKSRGSEAKSRSSSRSRSSSSAISPQRTSDARFSQKTQNARSRSHSLTSLSSDEEQDLKPRNRPHTPKTPESDDNENSPRKIHTPASPPPDDSGEVDRTSPPPSGSPQSRYSSRSNSPKRLLSKSNDNASLKSVSSRSSRKSVSSRESNKAGTLKVSERSRRKSDDESSYSSDSSMDSSSRPKVNVADTQPEEISDGDIESDNEKRPESPKTKNVPKPEINIAHEDLSDVSDLDESIGRSDDEICSFTSAKEQYKNSVQETISNRSQSPEIKKVSENASRSDENEEQLDFEAEDGECGEEVNREKDEFNEKTTSKINDKDKTESRKEEKEELEEGEVTDDDDVRPEETQPRPVCRFFSRGQCTWGESCRFLHPGVTDKGNYTMFELIRPVVPGEYGRDDRLYGKPDPPLVESAWERGLRTAKEMLRKSVKRKEQDIDFEEKKMNLSLAQEEFDKENGYYGRGPSPEPRFVRHIPADYPVPRPPPPPEEYYPRRQVLYEHEFPPAPPRERGRPYRELPPHRMPDYYTNKYEEEPQTSKQRPRPKREVIVQRVEERQGRGDEWSDPWMRSKSPAGRRKDRKRSYSSGSSYSSSSSSRSSSGSSRSSYRSRSRSSYRRRRSRSRRSRQVSPSVIVSERKAANERAALMNPPAPKRRAPSPGMMRVSGAANPPAPPREDFGRSRSKLAMAAALARVKARKSSRSSSGSSGSSSSDSDSSDSSSSTSRDGSSPTRRPPGSDISLVKAMDALKGSAAEKKQIKLNLKNPVGAKKPEAAEFARKMEQTQGKKRPASPPSDKSKKATSRREELLKQLKAVEDAIAKKRSKAS